MRIGDQCLTPTYHSVGQGKIANIFEIKGNYHRLIIEHAIGLETKIIKSKNEQTITLLELMAEGGAKLDKQHSVVLEKITRERMLISEISGKALLKRKKAINNRLDKLFKTVQMSTTESRTSKK